MYLWPGITYSAARELMFSTSLKYILYVPRQQENKSLWITKSPEWASICETFLNFMQGIIIIQMTKITIMNKGVLL